MKWDGIFLIYNPKSTGDAPRVAKETARQLRDRGYSVDLRPTKYAQHAEKIARTLAEKYKRPLIVAVGGDGSYHEVVNGAYQVTDRLAVTVPLPAGNANDHFFAVTTKRLPELLTESRIDAIDALRIDMKIPNQKSVTRICHSYAGVGFTATAAEKLNTHSLNRWREIQLMWRALLEHEPDTIRVAGSRKRIDSIIFANVGRMAKVFSLANDQHLHDQQFEVIIHYHQRKRTLVWNVMKKLVRRRLADSTRRFQFSVDHDTAMQLDGELYALPAGTQVVISADAGAIRTLLPA